MGPANKRGFLLFSIQSRGVLSGIVRTFYGQSPAKSSGLNVGQRELFQGSVILPCRLKLSNGGALYLGDCLIYNVHHILG